MASTLAAPAAAASASTRAPHQSSLAQASPASSTIPAQNAGPHMLSLKVMRASAPSLAVSEKPYYDHAETSSQGGLIAAVGQGIEDGLSHDLLSSRWEGSNGAAEHFPISDLLVLPNSFGTLHLGETFRTYLCVRNEASAAVREPSLRVEMQVGASDPGSSGESGRWHQLAHVILPTPTRYSPDPTTEEDEGRPVWELPPGQPLETSLGYDIKDLGAHVLVCTVGYKSAVPQGEEVVWVERSFRKFYKFSVDRSPISVRTKVHQPRHASSVYHPEVGVRGRVELEVQVQNVSGNGASLVMGGMALRPMKGWRWESVDRPSLNGGGMDDMWLFKGTHELLADGDIRQYLFTLTPDTPTTLTDDAMKGGIDLGTSPDGHSIKGDALGHLDISWRMSLGEPGRLQTSQLVRRRVSTPPITISTSSTSGVKLDPRLRARVTLQPRAIEALRRVRAGDVLELDVDVDVCDVSALTLPDADEQAKVEGENDAGEGSDDDTPLSEIASSPRAAKRTTTTAAGERITVKRTLQLALQHCTIDLPPPLPTSVASNVEDGGASTPRKTPLPSRTSTPTISSALHKARLQANLSNLVRNTSLSSLRPRNSTDTDPGAGRSGTPQPPAPPPKEEGVLAGAAVVSEKPAPESKQEERRVLGTGIAWSRVEELYKTHLETHSQALTRSKGDPSGVPASFLPTPSSVQHLGTSLVPLAEVTLQMTMLKGPGGTLHRDPAGGGEQEGKAIARLTYILEDEVDEDKTVRLGALRVVLLGWRDERVDEQGAKVKEETREEMTVLKDVLVLAETLVSD